MSEHISFDEMVEHVFSEGKQDKLPETAARINRHIFECPECSQMYKKVITLQEQIASLNEEYDPEIDDHISAMTGLMAVYKEKTIESIIEECRRFRKWVAFNVKSFQELSEASISSFSHPKLAVEMKSASEDGVQINESTITSSLYDGSGNRVSVGIDGTLTLYFNPYDYKVKCNVLLLPDDDYMESQISEIKKYDNNTNYVQFYNIVPGKYSVMIAEN